MTPSEETSSSEKSRTRSISGFANSAGAVTQGWKLGAGTEVIAQGIQYDENIYAKIYMTKAIIAGHVVTGPQTLVFRYFTANNATASPFQVYNPNAADDARLAQTQSVYTVWEIEQ